MRSIFLIKGHLPEPERGVTWKWWLRIWLPAIVAVGVICTESTQTFSAQNTSSWLRPVFERWFGHIADSTWDLFHHYLRKTGHFLGYGTVGVTFLRGWMYTLRQRGLSSLLAWRVQASLLAIASTAIIASGDEFHQTFLPGRTGTPVDVLLDTTGAATMCLLLWLVIWARSGSGGNPQLPQKAQ